MNWWHTCLAFGCLLSTLGCSDAISHHWPESADPETGIVLRLTPETQTIKKGESPTFTAVLVNEGTKEVVLIEPGDGSACGRRTPLVEWSRQPRQGARCVRTNHLKSDEVFKVEAGDSHELNEWVGVPYLSGPGRYRVSLRYSNQPDRDVPVAPDDTSTLDAVRSSTPVTVVSNIVEVVVE